MLSIITLALAAAQPSGLTHLECVETDGKVWSIMLNEFDASVTFGLTKPARPVTRTRAFFQTNEVMWEIGRPHPLTGEQPIMGVNRNTLKFVMSDIDMQGNFKGWRVGRCSVIDMAERAF